jgi:hypothetical protein
MSIREGLGYSLRYYDPCFNYNADRFCCSNRGDHFRKNILLSNCAHTKTDSYTAPRNNDPNDTRPLFIKQTGLVDPDPYTFTPQDNWNVWCSRMPCSVDQKGVPCQNGMPRCSNPNTCSK